MTNMMQNVAWVGSKIGAKTGGLLLAAIAGVGTLGAAQAPAQAQVRIGLDIRGPERRETVYEEHDARVWVEPVYRTVTERIWVEGGYTTSCDRVWVPPVTQCVTEQVWVPARVEDHEEVEGYGRRRHVEHEREVVEPGHYVTQTRTVEIAAGHYDDVQRQVWTDGHWQDSSRQELICAGHWETRTERVPVREERSDGDWLRFEIGGHRH